MDKGWKFHPGDDLAWAQPTFNDSRWERINPTQDLHELPAVMATGLGWLRLRLAVSGSLREEALAALVNQHCASEIYLNGKLLKRYGSLGLDGMPVQSYNPLRQIPLLLPFNQSPEQVLAVRFAIQSSVPYIRYLGTSTRLLSLEINSLESVTDIQWQQELAAASRTYTKLGLFLLLAFLHLCFFWFYPAQRANLYFGLYAFIISLGYSGEALYKWMGIVSGPEGFLRKVHLPQVSSRHRKATARRCLL
jgi:hypothetical protein